MESESAMHCSPLDLSQEALAVFISLGFYSPSETRPFAKAVAVVFRLSHNTKSKSQYLQFFKT